MLTKSITKKIGKEKHVFLVEGEDFMDVMRKAQNLSFPDVHKCGICGSENLTLSYHKAGDDGEFEYITIRCKNPDCRASLNFGQQKKNKDTFYLRTKKDESGNMMRNDQGFPIYDWQKFEPKG